MRKLIIPGFVLLVLLVSVTPAWAIVYGNLDGEGHPNVGLISRLDSNTGNQRAVCTGTLIAPNVFLTAGHCTVFLEQLPLGNVKVSFSADNALNEDLIAVSAIETHPDFGDNNASNVQNDVGILILAESLGIDPAALPSEGFLNDLKAAKELKGAIFTVVGYGATIAFPPPQLIPPDGKRRVAESSFQSLQQTRVTLSQNQNHDNGGTCAGDSGGPVFWTDGTLVGITSSGDPNCTAIGTYYRTDIADTIDFIDPYINSAICRIGQYLNPLTWLRLWRG